MQEKKSLIWYISFGSYYHKEATKLSVLSLIEWGKFTGDIVILTDQDSMNDDIHLQYTNIRVINISNFLKQRIPSADLTNKWNIFCLKPLIHHFVDISKYNYALYLDSDVLIPNEKINFLLQFYAVENKIQIQHNGEWNVTKNKGSTGSDVLTPEEKKKYWHLSLCAGVVGIPTNNIGLKFLKEWEKKNEEGNWTLDDQGNLFWVIINKFWQNWVYCEDVSRTQWAMDKSICHYGGSQAKEMFWEHSKRLYKYHKSDAQEKILGKWRHVKECEGIDNIWEFCENRFVYVSWPQIAGVWMETKDYIVIWWTTGGFEKIPLPMNNEIIGISYRGGQGSFTLTKSN